MEGGGVRGQGGRRESEHKIGRRDHRLDMLFLHPWPLGRFVFAAGVKQNRLTLTPDKFPW